jgi:hypothetical protein
VLKERSHSHGEAKAFDDEGGDRKVPFQLRIQTKNCFVFTRVLV